MTAGKNRILRLAALAVMYLFAAPILILEWAKKLQKEIRAIGTIRGGILPCPYCTHENPLNRMATCARCRATEPGSVLRCSFCKATYKTLTCDGCGATLRVL